MVSTPTTMPELPGDKSAALQMYETQLDKMVRTCSGPRRGYVHERGVLLKKLMSLKVGAVRWVYVVRLVQTHTSHTTVLQHAAESSGHVKLTWVGALLNAQ